MNDHDDDLRRLLHDAVDHVTPHEGLTSIRSKTKEKKMSARRPVLFGAGGAAVATAAVIGVIVWSGGLGGGDDKPDSGPASAPTAPSATVDDSTPSEPTTTGSTDAPEPSSTSAAVPVYYIGDTPRGPGLYREFHRNPDGTDPIFAAVDAAIRQQPLDPDYRTVWPEGAEVQEIGVETDRIVIGLTGDLRERPSSISAKDAAMAVQQLVYTAQAAHGQGRVPVQLTLNGSPSDTILGVPTAEPLAAGKLFKTLSLMSITSPAEGATVSGSFTATGVANSFEAWVGYQILKDGQEVATGFGTAEGAMEEKLFPWEVEVDLSGLAPGEYVLRFHTDDPTGGAEGNGPDEDTRTIIVK
ncbi:Gmad2 immunoglobulin-like domain-containing protein [Nocardioides daejeonensis]|uniref:Gmad2 immunoglobulin-like domain-containing protein n=1 Tax=Nocardioides daejeonensis TaxID=1046556 RepID=UPI000D74C987|nr:Gmad2 immunoglobulin-like domain-containing protein [Nocardioides daejeonensis]